MLFASVIDTLAASRVFVHFRINSETRSLDMRDGAATAVADTNQLITRKEVAAYAGVTLRALAHWEAAGTAPKRIKITNRCIRYRLSDVQAWLAAREQS